MLHLEEKKLSESIMHMMFCIMNTHTFAYVCVFHLKKKLKYTNDLCDSQYIQGHNFQMYILCSLNIK